LHQNGWEARERALCSAQTAGYRESTSGLKGERRIEAFEGWKELASGPEDWTPKIMTDRRHCGLLY